MKHVLEVVHSLYAYLIRPGKNLKKAGEWAIVTGATDGIGQGIAFELAKKGLSVLLISRTESKLKDTAKYVDKKKTPFYMFFFCVCSFPFINIILYTITSQKGA